MCYDLKAEAPKQKPQFEGQTAVTPSHIGRNYPRNEWIAKTITTRMNPTPRLEWRVK